MPPPDQLFQRLLRDSFDDTHRSPTPRASSSWTSSTATPSRVRQEHFRSGGTSGTKQQSGVVGVRGSNVTTPYRVISQRDNPLSNASSSSAQRRRDGPVENSQSHRNAVHGVHVSPLSARKGYVVAQRGNSLDCEGPSQLVALEHVLEDEMEQLRLLTEAVEQRIERVMSLDEQRQAILRAAQRQQFQQRSTHHGFEDDLPVSSSVRKTKGVDTPEHQRRLDDDDDARPRRHRDPLGVSSLESTVDSRESNVLAVVDLPAASRNSPWASAQRTPKTPQGPATAALQQNQGHDCVEVLATMSGVTPLTVSRSSRRGSDAMPSEGELLVVTLSNDANGQQGSPHTKVQQRQEASEQRTLASRQDSPHSMSASHLATQREIHEQRSASAKLLLAQTHAAQADVLKYEEDLLSLQDALITEQRRPNSADPRSADTLMHLRVVVRDELSKCKKRHAVLQQLETQLKLTTEAR